RRGARNADRVAHARARLAAGRRLDDHAGRWQDAVRQRQAVHRHVGEARARHAASPGRRRVRGGRRARRRGPAAAPRAVGSSAAPVLALASGALSRAAAAARGSRPDFEDANVWRHHRRAAKAREPRWASYSDEELLDLRLCDLAPDLSIEGTWLEARIEQLYRELERCGIVFRPHFWLSDDWFTPEGVPGIAIPFYLAHPRLARLEEAQMLEVEGGTPEWCMRILRHETGHAIDNAFRLRRLRRRQQLFGRSSVPYPESYAPRPYS